MGRRKSVVERRWAADTPHHPEAVRDLDHHDEVDLRFGGDGDFGETLLYLLSEVLEKQDD